MYSIAGTYKSTASIVESDPHSPETLFNLTLINLGTKKPICFMTITDIKATIWCNNYILKYLYNHYSLKNLHCCPKSAFSDLKIVLDD